MARQFKSCISYRYIIKLLITIDQNILVSEIPYSGSISLNSALSVAKSIRIYHECEGRIEKSAPRIAVWHHEACQVMTNGDPEGLIFLSYPHTNNGFFFLLTTVFIYFLFILKLISRSP